MAGSTELSLEAVRDFILQNGGKVRNHDLVKHFKKHLTKPQNRDDARNHFKEIVNEVALIRTEGEEKYLILKRKFRPPGLEECFSPTSPSSSTSHPVVRMPLEPIVRSGTPPRQPPPYRAPPPPVTPTKSNPPTPVTSSPASSPSTPPCDPIPTQEPPPVPVRKKSASEKSKKEHHMDTTNTNQTKPPDPESSNDVETECDRKISVKERLQKFNRMASESDLLKVPTSNSTSNNNNKKKIEKEDDDTSSVSSLDPKRRKWFLHAAKGDYQALAKLAAECPRLVRLKDPSSGTALHWAAKHGNVDLVKLIAGTYKLDPNVRTNGGYTPLHIAMQFEREEIFDLLVQVYAADQNLRDWSGRKPRQYRTNSDTSVSADTFRKIKARKKYIEKESGFLRIGSLNVRVKRTTEAFSNYFLGQSSDKLHKSWGSADNVHDDDKKLMQPPKSGPIKKRKSKREFDYSSSRSTPTTPTQNRSSTISVGSMEQQDSDSDTAAGFGANWQT